MTNKVSRRDFINHLKESIAENKLELEKNNNLPDSVVISKSGEDPLEDRSKNSDSKSSSTHNSFRSDQDEEDGVEYHTFESKGSAKFWCLQ